MRGALNFLHRCESDRVRARAILARRPFVRIARGRPAITPNCPAERDTRREQIDTK